MSQYVQLRRAGARREFSVTLPLHALKTNVLKKRQQSYFWKSININRYTFFKSYIVLKYLKIIDDTFDVK